VAGRSGEGQGVRLYRPSQHPTAKKNELVIVMVTAVMNNIRESKNDDRYDKDDQTKTIPITTLK
jgi:hypothetical protein